MTAEDDTQQPFLDTVDGEISFFRSVMRTRPIGIHRHFHALAVRLAIHRDTGQWVETDEIWRKMRECFNLEILESLEQDGFDIPGARKPPTAIIPRPPSPSENLLTHPYFRAEYTLPEGDSTIEDALAKRRMRGSASAESTPAPSPAQEKEEKKPTRGTKRKGKQAKNMAGLVGGDSDSSALTQDSGDESQAATPATGTDNATEYAEGEQDEEVPDSPAPSVSARGRKGRGGRRLSGAAAMRARGNSSRGVKKRKR